jgi:hypothetical protein
MAKMAKKTKKSAFEVSRDYHARRAAGTETIDGWEGRLAVGQRGPFGPIVRVGYYQLATLLGTLVTSAGSFSLLYAAAADSQALQRSIAVAICVVLLGFVGTLWLARRPTVRMSFNAKTVEIGSFQVATNAVTRVSVEEVWGKGALWGHWLIIEATDGDFKVPVPGEHLALQAKSALEDVMASAMVNEDIPVELAELVAGRPQSVKA